MKREPKTTEPKITTVCGLSATIRSVEWMMSDLDKICIGYSYPTIYKNNSKIHKKINKKISHILKLLVSGFTLFEDVYTSGEGGNAMLLVIEKIRKIFYDSKIKDVEIERLIFDKFCWNFYFDFSILYKYGSYEQIIETIGKLTDKQLIG